MLCNTSRATAPGPDPPVSMGAMVVGEVTGASVGVPPVVSAAAKLVDVFTTVGAAVGDGALLPVPPTE